MALLRLDYQRRMLPFPWAGMFLLLLSITALLIAGVYYRDLAGKAVLWEAKARPLQRMSGKSDGSVASVDIEPEIKHANEVLQRLTLPWGKLFDAIESSSDRQVALLGMEPDAEKRLVKISGEAKDIQAVLDYIRRLSAQQVFNSVYLQSHQIQQQDPEKPVRFVLLAAWMVSP